MRLQLLPLFSCQQHDTHAVPRTEISEGFYVFHTVFHGLASQFSSPAAGQPYRVPSHDESQCIRASRFPPVFHGPCEPNAPVGVVHAAVLSELAYDMSPTSPCPSARRSERPHADQQYDPDVVKLLLDALRRQRDALQKLSLIAVHKTIVSQSALCLHRDITYF